MAPDPGVQDVLIGLRAVVEALAQHGRELGMTFRIPCGSRYDVLYGTQLQLPVGSGDVNQRFRFQGIYFGIQPVRIHVVVAHTANTWFFPAVINAGHKMLPAPPQPGARPLWNIETGDVLRRYNSGWIMSFDFTEDGRHALAGYRDGSLEIWRINSTLEELLDWTESNRYVPELTCDQCELYNIEPLCDAPE